MRGRGIWGVDFGLIRKDGGGWLNIVVASMFRFLFPVARLGPLTRNSLCFCFAQRVGMFIDVNK
jgi:hypothetical protein